MTNNVQELENIFTSEFCESIPEVKPVTKSFIGSILKSNENRLQALFTYCLSPIEGHDVNSIFLEALCECISDLPVDFYFDDYHEGYEVFSEHVCFDGGRIDILIKTTEPWDATRKAIIVEMKIDSVLHNNLEDYYNSITDCREENKIGIVLGINDISDTISHDKFYFISLNQIFDKIKVVYEKEKDEIKNENDLYFFKDFFAYVEKFQRNFLDIDTKQHLVFLFKNQLILYKLRKTFNCSKLNDELNVWYLANKYILDKIRQSKYFAFNSISSFCKDWLKVNYRDGQVRKEGKVFIRDKKGSIFKDLYRFSIDYSECLEFKPIVNFRLEISGDFDSNALLGINHEAVCDIVKDVDSDYENITDKSQNNGWTEVVKISLTDEEEIVDFYNFFYEKINEIIKKVENHLEQNLYNRFREIIQNEIIKNSSDELELDNSELVDSIHEELIYREPSDSLFITLKWQTTKKITISIWSTYRSEKWLLENLIKSKLDKWKIHSFEDAFCFYTVDLIGDNQLKEVYRNFSLELLPEDLNQVYIISQKTNVVFDILKEMDRIEFEEKD
jgi:hypothetical protein